MSLLDVLSQTLSGQALGLPQVLLATGAGLLAGLVSSLLPCNLAVLPLMMGYLGASKQTPSRANWALKVGLFGLGVALTLTTLGVGATLLGHAFGGWLAGGWLYRVVGTVAILMGLTLLGVWHGPTLGVFQRLPQINLPPALLWLEPLLVGAFSGLVASPCGTPYLVAVLSVIGQFKQVGLGAWVLFCYALGQSVPLLLVGLLAGWGRYMAGARQLGQLLNTLSGAVFVLAGLWFWWQSFA